MPGDGRRFRSKEVLTSNLPSERWPITGSFPLRFDPPLAPGRYRMWLEARVSRPGAAKPETETFRTAPQEIDWGT